jgi:hypothetical protein
MQVTKTATIKRVKKIPSQKANMHQKGHQFVHESMSTLLLLSICTKKSHKLQFGSLQRNHYKVCNHYKVVNSSH